MPVRLEGSPDYLIFFDNVRVDGLVKTWNVSLMLNQISQASLSMLYFDELYSTIEQRTIVKIFMRNMFTLQYDMVFDGELQGRMHTRRGGELELTYVAEDYQSWLNQTPNPIFFSIQSQMADRALQYMWGAQGIDYTKIKGIITESQAEERGESIEALWNRINRVLESGYALAQEPNSSFAWARLKERMSIMADIDGSIDEHILKSMKLVWTGSVLKSIYSSLATATSRFLLEMYQDRDGLIRIKPAFRMAAIPRMHIIDPSLEIEATENTSWKRRVTRTLVTGGVQTLYEQSVQAQQLLTPVGFYTESAGYVSNEALPRVNAGQITNKTSPLTNFKMWLDFNKVTSEFGPRPEKPVPGVSDFHHGTDFGYEQGTSIYSLFPGSIQDYGYDTTRGNYAVVSLDGPLDDIEIHFFHLSAFGGIFQTTPDGATWHVGTETVLGYVGSTGASTGPHLHVGVFQKSRGEFINLRGWLADWSSKQIRNTQWDQFAESLKTDGYSINDVRRIQEDWEESGKPPISVTGTPAYDINGDTELPRLLEITDLERKYGIFLNQVQHELLRPDSGPTKTTGIPLHQLLRQFAQLSYEHSNTEATATTLNLVAAPWLRPGFNIWCNPSLGDKSRVYYLQSISHSGSMESGSYTTLGATGGLNLNEFKAERARYAAQKQSDNFFLTRLNASPGSFGDLATDYDWEVDQSRRFQRMFGRATNNMPAHQSQYLRNLYTNQIQPQANRIAGQWITNQWSGDLSYSSILAQIAAEYDRAPVIVKQRAEALQAAVNKARDKALLYYTAGKAVERI